MGYILINLCTLELCGTCLFYEVIFMKQTNSDPNIANGVPVKLNTPNGVPVKSSTPTDMLAEFVILVEEHQHADEKRQPVTATVTTSPLTTLALTTTSGKLPYRDIQKAARALLASPKKEVNKAWARFFSALLLLAILTEIPYATVNAGAAGEQLQPILEKMGITDDPAYATNISIGLASVAFLINVVQFHIGKLGKAWASSEDAKKFTQNFIENLSKPKTWAKFFFLSPYMVTGALTDLLELPMLARGPLTPVGVITTGSACVYYLGFDGRKLKERTLKRAQNFASKMYQDGEFALALTGGVESLGSAAVRGLSFAGMAEALNSTFNWGLPSIVSVLVGIDTFLVAVAARNSLVRDERYEGIELAPVGKVNAFAAEKTWKEFWKLQVKLFLLATVGHTVPLSVPLYVLGGPGTIPIALFFSYCVQRGEYRLALRHEFTETKSNKNAKMLLADMQAIEAFLLTESFNQIKTFVNGIGRVDYSESGATILGSLETHLNSVRVPEAWFNSDNAPARGELIRESNKLILLIEKQQAGDIKNKALTFLRVLNHTVNAIGFYVVSDAHNPKALDVLNKKDEVEMPIGRVAKWSTGLSGAADLTLRVLGVVFFVRTFLSGFIHDDTTDIALSVWVALLVFANTWRTMVDKDAMRVTQDYGRAVKQGASFLYSKLCPSTGDRTPLLADSNASSTASSGTGLTPEDMQLVETSGTTRQFS